MTIATAASWKHLPEPAQRIALGYEERFDPRFDAAAATRLRRGLVPVAMEDKWFIYLEGGWLRFHRSWTGNFIFALKLVADGDGLRVIESWVSRDPAQYQSTDLDRDREVLRNLVLGMVQS